MYNEPWGSWVCESYISIDVILEHHKSVPKTESNDNFKSNNNFLNNIIYQINNSMMSENKLFNILNTIIIWIKPDLKDNSPKNKNKTIFFNEFTMVFLGFFTL